jgi:hypothetical protein
MSQGIGMKRGANKRTMTINVVLVTNEALILGCDSTASRGDYYIDPFQIGLELGTDGKILEEADGRVTVKFRYDQNRQYNNRRVGRRDQDVPLV